MKEISLTPVENSRSVRVSRTQFNFVELFNKRALRRAPLYPKNKKRVVKVYK